MDKTVTKTQASPATQEALDIVRAHNEQMRKLMPVISASMRFDGDVPLASNAGVACRRGLAAGVRTSLRADLFADQQRALLRNQLPSVLRALKGDWGRVSNDLAKVYRDAVAKPEIKRAVEAHRAALVAAGKRD
jgi:hypothetical protein